MKNITTQKLSEESTDTNFGLAKLDVEPEFPPHGFSENLVKETRILQGSIMVKAATEKIYALIRKAWCAWLHDNNHIRPEEDAFGEILSPSTPSFIILWIMECCDPSYADGTPKPASQLRSSYSYAQQIRAALAHAYANSFNRGSEKWAKIYSSEQNTQAEKVLNSERYKGNPTTSVILRKYMIALRKRKLQSGEIIEFKGSHGRGYRKNVTRLPVKDK